MICGRCAADDHEGCEGARHATYCDCQHVKPGRAEIALCGQSRAACECGLRKGHEEEHHCRNCGSWWPQEDEDGHERPVTG